jgi:hypothetical protein
MLGVSTWPNWGKTKEKREKGKRAQARTEMYLRMESRRWKGNSISYV